jgi:hypothetical protein
MKNYKLILVIFLTVAIYACNGSGSNANKLVFKDKAINVQDSLLKMENLIKELPSNIEDFNTNYEFRNDSLIINNIPGRSIDSISIYSNRALKNLKTNERIVFLNLAKYLKNNYITSGYINRQVNLCLFEYRYLPKNTFDDLRELALLQKSDTIVFHKQYKILDNDSLIYLIAPIDAR